MTKKILETNLKEVKGIKIVCSKCGAYWFIPLKVINLYNPATTGQQIRFKPDTESGGNWTANPETSGHFFPASGFQIQKGRIHH